MWTPSPSPPEGRTPSPSPKTSRPPSPSPSLSPVPSSHKPAVSQFFLDNKPPTRYEFRPKEPLRVEFNRLARHKRWNSIQRQHRWVDCLVGEVEMCLADCFGTPIVVKGDDGAPDLVVKGKLANLIHICRKFGVDIDPRSRFERVVWALHDIHVNLLDWLDSQRSGAKPFFFTHVDDLWEYTHRQGKYLPSEAVDQLPYLHVLAKRDHYEFIEKLRRTSAAGSDGDTEAEL